jgi:hypothetical protein
VTSISDRTVQVVEVDRVHAEAQQRRLAAALDVGGLAAPAKVAHAAVDADLGRQLDLVAAPGDGAPDEHLVVPGAVGVSARVEAQAGSS